VLKADLDGRIVVFAGPSLPAGLRPSDPRLVWLEPAKAGDGLRLAGRGAAAVALIDGVFDEQPSIRHKELLVLMAEGTALFGAASMGALRAAELHAFGMIGIGRIFEAYADGRLTGDDEVALAHAPAELGWQPLSEPLVNIRATLQEAVHAGVIAPRSARKALEIAARSFYRERTWAGILTDAHKARAMSAEDLAALELWLASGKVDQKQIDALACLQAALAWEGPAAPSPAPPHTVFTRTLASQIAPPAPARPEPRARPAGTVRGPLPSAADCDCPPTP
jgi:hypothetical protein